MMFVTSALMKILLFAELAAVCSALGPGKRQNNALGQVPQMGWNTCVVSQTMKKSLANYSMQLEYLPR